MALMPHNPSSLTPRFLCRGQKFAILADAAQEAEFRHPCSVTALVTEPECYVEGEVVYVSKGAPGHATGCRLCGKPLAYSGAVYCGAACCVRWEGGERP